jgi:nickel-dependent lactate racemase
VIASPGGHPKDIELYQSQKAIEEATQVVEPGGNVLITACCEEGSGSQRFEEWMDAAYSADDIIRRIQDEFVMGGHKAYQIAREVQRANVLSVLADPSRPCSLLDDAPLSDRCKTCERLIDQARSITVLPQATLTRAVLPSRHSSHSQKIV